MSRSALHLIRSRIKGHRITLFNLNMGTCIGAGVFTLLPGRFLGNLVCPSGWAWGDARTTKKLTCKLIYLSKTASF